MIENVPRNGLGQLSKVPTTTTETQAEEDKEPRIWEIQVWK